MGILNITPDSFYTGSRVTGIDSVLTRVQLMLQDGATILDIGGYSSRPGAKEVSIQEELDRVLPVVHAISKAFPNAILSIDTFRSEVAQQAIEAGAHIINDISGGDLDEKMFSTAAELAVPYIMMHMQGTPETMQNQPSYNNVTLDIIKDLSKKIDLAKSAGIKDILIDPGFGFGKTIEQNYQLLQQLSSFHLLNCSLLIGISRKSMVYKPLSITPEESLPVTTALHLKALEEGISILRVHDVAEAKQIITIFQLMQKTKDNHE